MGCVQLNLHAPARGKQTVQGGQNIYTTLSSPTALLHHAGDDGDDQPPYHRPFSVNPRVVLGALGTFCIAALCDAGGLRVCGFGVLGACVFRV